MAVPKRKKPPTVKPTVKGELKGKGPKAEPYNNPEGKFTVPKNLKSDKVTLRGGTNDSGPLDPVPDRELFASQKTLPKAIAKKLRQTADPASAKSAMEALESAAISHEKEPSQGTGIYRQAWRSLGPAQQDEAIRILGSMDKRTGKELTPSAQQALIKREALIRRAFDSPDEVPDSDLYTSVPKNNTEADRVLALQREGMAPSDAVDALTPKKRELLAAANYHSSVLEEEWARVHAMFPENEEGRQLSLSGPFRNAKDQLNRIIKAHPELEPLISTENIEDQIMPPDPEEPDTSRVRYRGTQADSSSILGSKGAKAGYVEERADRRDMRANPAWRSILQMQKMEDLPGKPEPKLLPVIAKKVKGVQKTPTIFSDVQGIDKSLGYITADSEAGTPAQTKFTRSRAVTDQRTQEQKALEQLVKLLQGNTQDLGSIEVGDQSKISPNVDTLSGSSNTDSPKQIVNRSKQANTQERQRDINLDLAVPQWRALVHQLSEDGTSIEWGRLTPEQIAGIYLGNLNSGTVAPENVASAIRQLVPAIKRAMENAPVTLANEAGNRYKQARGFENKRLPSNTRVSKLVKQSQAMNGPEFSPSVDLEGADATPSFESSDRIPEDGENIEVPSMVQEAPAAPAAARVIDTSPTYWDKAFERGTISAEHYAVIKADQDANPRYIETPVQETVTRKKRPDPVEEEFIPRDAGQQMLDNPDLPMQSGADTQRQLARILGEKPSPAAPQVAPVSAIKPFRGVDDRPTQSWETVEEPNIMPNSEVAEGVRIPEDGEQSFIDTGLANPTNDQRTLQTLLAIRDAAKDERITTPTMQPPGRTRRVAEEADFPNPMSQEEWNAMQGQGQQQGAGPTLDVGENGQLRLIIAGGRDYQFSDQDIALLNDIHSKSPITEVVSGGAKGADSHGEAWARANNIPVTQFKADWANQGRAAGPLRNQQMANNADALLAFPGGAGTRSMVSLAKEQGLPVIGQKGSPGTPEPMPEMLTAEQWYSGPRAGGQSAVPFMEAKAARKQVQGEVIQQKGAPTADSDPQAFMDNLRDSILRPLEIQNNIDATAAIVKKPEIQQSPMNMGPSFFTRQSDSGMKELVPQANPTQSAIERILQSLLEQQQRP